MAKIQIVVCDVCQDKGRPTQSYRILRNGMRYNIELCTEHAGPIEAILEHANESRATRPARFEDAVTTMEEIEQRKRELAEDEKRAPAASR